MDLSWLDTHQPFDRRELSEEGRYGLGAARALQHHRGNEVAPVLRDLAHFHGRHPSTIRRWIHKARLELSRERRPCLECDNLLPLGSRSSRHYCDDHANAHARVRRHRAKTQAQA